jgi:hypothetical protein
VELDVALEVNHAAQAHCNCVDRVLFLYLEADTSKQRERELRARACVDVVFPEKKEQRTQKDQKAPKNERTQLAASRPSLVNNDREFCVVVDICILTLPR